MNKINFQKTKWFELNWLTNFLLVLALLGVIGSIAHSLIHPANASENLNADAALVYSLDDDGTEELPLTDESESINNDINGIDPTQQCLKTCLGISDPEKRKQCYQDCY